MTISYAIRRPHLKNILFDKCHDAREVNIQSTTRCLVKLFMGPYEAHGIIRHRSPRLRGLRDILSESGYHVELIYTKHLNRFTMEFYGREIFRCNIMSFQFNLPCEEDPVCTQAVKVLREHEQRFTAVNNLPNYINIERGIRVLEHCKHKTTCEFLTESNISLVYEIKKEEHTSRETLNIAVFDNKDMPDINLPIYTPKAPLPSVEDTPIVTTRFSDTPDYIDSETTLVDENAQKKPAMNIMERVKLKTKKQTRFLKKSEEIMMFEDDLLRSDKHNYVSAYLKDMAEKRRINSKTSVKTRTSLDQELDAHAHSNED